MKKTFRTLVGTGVLAAALSSGAAHALPFIVGSIGISDGGLTLSGLPTSITNQLTSLTLGTAATSGCQGTANFATAPTVCASASVPASTLTIPLVSGPASGSLTYVGLGGDVYTFTFTSIFGTVNRVANHDVGGGLIKDHIDFVALGTVSDSLGSFATTAAALGWSADGSCFNTTGSTTCDANTASAAWAGTLVALGRQTVPEPETLGLLGIALVGLGLSRRRKQA